MPIAKRRATKEQKASTLRLNIKISKKQIVYKK